MDGAGDNPLTNHLERVLLYPYFALMHRLRWYGTENVPRRGPAILVANHQSFYDPVLIGIAVNRHIVYMGWERYYNMPVVGPLMRFQGTVPVDTDTPAPSSLARMLRALRQGRLCGIFPEAGRTTDGLIGPPKPGAVLLALRSGAPLVPITIHGAYRAWPAGQPFPSPAPISLYFGEPLRLERSRRRRGSAEQERRRDITHELMLRIADGFGRLGRPDLACACRSRLRALWRGC